MPSPSNARGVVPPKIQAAVVVRPGCRTAICRLPASLAVAGSSSAAQSNVASEVIEAIEAFETTEVI